jgi:hypothetical protein
VNSRQSSPLEVYRKVRPKKAAAVPEDGLEEWLEGPVKKVQTPKSRVQGRKAGAKGAGKVSRKK